ncbi:rod shape-determining protein MreD [Catenulispora subtropica]|uniref:Rod shape-determining protein MreD n=1 Tax=Catenulispora subtropica TaxID=450798 RepID=A0ABP5DD92_9ACTN
MRLTGILALLCGLALVLVLQDLLLTAVHLPLAAPDLLLAVVAAVAFVRGPRAALILGFLLGLAADLTPPAAHAIGSQAFVLCLSGYLAGRLAPAVRGTVLRPILGVACLAGLAPFLYRALDYAVGSGEFQGVTAAAAASALYTGVLAPFVVPVVGFVLSRGESRGLPTQRSHTKLPGVKTLNRRASAGSTQVL